MIPEKNIDYLQSEVNKDVQAAYSKMLKIVNDFDIFGAMRLKRLTCVEPRIGEQAVRAMYSYYFKRADCRGVSWVKDFTGIKPCMDEQMTEEIQAVYADCIKGHDIELVKRMKDFTGIRPRTDERMKEAVQEEYKALFGKFLLTRAEDLEEFTGIKPEMDECMKGIVQMNYSYYADYDYCFNGITRIIKKLTGIGPSEAILKKYPQYAEVFK